MVVLFRYVVWFLYWFVNFVLLLVTELLLVCGAFVVIVVLLVGAAGCLLVLSTLMCCFRFSVWAVMVVCKVAALYLVDCSCVWV